MDTTTKIYPASGDYDRNWGTVIETVGCAEIEAGYTSYPPEGHPEGYEINLKTGRILDIYVLLYIVKGKGVLRLDSGNHSSAHPITEGDIILLQPGQRHCYYPEKKTGWKEYWIGFKGFITDFRRDYGFFDKMEPVQHIGTDRMMSDLFEQALKVATDERSAFQQMLSGIVGMMISRMIYISRNRSRQDTFQESKIREAQIFMREHFRDAISPESVADEIGMSYSWLRSNFKEYTNLSVSQYLQNLKLAEAKRLLLDTDIRIKEIAYNLNFDSQAYFAIAFKKSTGLTPSEYREAYNHSPA